MKAIATRITDWLIDLAEPGEPGLGLNRRRIKKDAEIDQVDLVAVASWTKAVHS